MADSTQQYSDLPAGAQIVSVPQVQSVQTQQTRPMPDIPQPLSNGTTDVASNANVGGIPASFGGLGKTGYDMVSDAVHQLPPTYKAYEQARSQGKGVMDSLSAANAEAGRQREAHDLLIQRVKEFKTNPDVATGRAITD